MGEQYHQHFIQLMRASRNLPIMQVLKNLNILTEDSDDDVSFKLPMYKYLEQEEHEIISRETIESFNMGYLKLQRHQLALNSNIEDAYLKMICDALN